MSQLIAKSSVLFQSRMYSPGDPLPANNPIMRDAWLEAGTAVLEDDELTTVEIDETAAVEAEATEAIAAEEEPQAEADTDAKIGTPVYDKDMKLVDLQQIAAGYGIDASKMQKKVDVIAAIEAATADK